MIGLGSEARASSSIMGASASGTSSAERPAQVTRPGSATRMVARARWWLPWSKSSTSPLLNASYPARVSS